MVEWPDHHFFLIGIETQVVMRKELRLASLSFCVLCALGCLCGYELRTSSHSPDDRFVAEVVQVNCGATTTYTQHVRIRRNWLIFGQEERMVVLEGTPEIKLCWLSKNKLLVFHQPAPLFHQKKNWNQILMLMREEEHLAQLDCEDLR